MIIPFDLVIVSHNAKQYLIQCIESLSIVKPRKIVVVDNASTDGSWQWLLNCRSDVEIILRKENLGYARGCNVGAEACNSPIIGFLNMDTAFTEDIQPMINYLWRKKDVAVVGPKQVDSNGIIRFGGVVFRLSGAKPWMKTLVGSYHRGWAEKDVGLYEDVIDSHYVSGSAFFMRRELFDKVGGFDERLSLYFEDNLMCLRLQKLGYRAVYFGQVKMKHEWKKSDNKRERNKRLWESLNNFRSICEKEGLKHRLDWFKEHR